MQEESGCRRALTLLGPLDRGPADLKVGASIHHHDRRSDMLDVVGQVVEVVANRYDFASQFS